ncbi:tetratricopeptide repeat protein [Lolliginicoccus levis]|uniref:tetratricopeptide repeat protein n=1 Tax=Lolliginicoccus levis TaxID=2919542 RepID=UPI00241E97D5|nr:tetratricopeptide repeat protein [Lolliginicoccus levis]
MASDAPPQAETLTGLMARRRDARDADDHATVTTTSRTLWQRWVAAGDTEQLLADARAERAHARRLNLAEYRAICDSAIGLAHLRRGELDDAEAAFHEAARQLTRSGSSGELAVANHHLGETCIKLGRIDDARRHLQAAAGVFREHNASVWLAKSHVKLAETYALHDSQARHHFKAALAALMQAKKAPEAGHCAMRLAEAHAAASDTKTAMTLYQEAATVLEHVERHALQAEALARLATLQAVSNKIREAEFNYDKARTASIAARTNPLTAACDIAIALLWDEQARKSYRREAILFHTVNLMLPATIVLTAIHGNNDQRAETWRPLLAQLLGWSVTALPGREHAQLRSAITDYARHHNAMTIDDEPEPISKGRKPHTPTLLPLLPHIMDGIDKLGTFLPAPSHLTAAATGAHGPLAPFLESARHRFPRQEA